MQGCHIIVLGLEGYQHSLENRIKRTHAWNDWLNEEWNWYGYSTQIIVVEYHFEAPLDNKGARSEQPYKTIQTEYLTVNMMMLVGTVGGTLGMFVGFSFVGFAEWVMIFSYSFKSMMKSIKIFR